MGDHAVAGKSPSEIGFRVSGGSDVTVLWYSHLGSHETVTWKSGGGPCCNTEKNDDTRLHK